MLAKVHYAVRWAGRGYRNALMFGPRSTAALPFLESARELGAEGDPARLNEPEQAAVLVLV